MMGDAIEAALDVGASHCLNLPDEIVWQIAVVVATTGSVGSSQLSSIWAVSMLVGASSGPVGSSEVSTGTAESITGAAGAEDTPSGRGRRGTCGTRYSP